MGLLQMAAAKRAENHFNGVGATSSGKQWAKTTSRAYVERAFLTDSFQGVVRLFLKAKRPEVPSLASADASNEIFALDTGADFPHSEITSQPAQRPVPRSRSLHACLDAALQFS